MRVRKRKSTLVRNTGHICYGMYRRTFWCVSESGAVRKASFYRSSFNEDSDIDSWWAPNMGTYSGDTLMADEEEAIKEALKRTKIILSKLIKLRKGHRDRLNLIHRPR